MDFATGVGFLVGIAVVLTLVLLGGDLRMFYDLHALIVIGGGVLAATMIRFPFSGIAHGLPLGFRGADRRHHPRPALHRGAGAVHHAP
jgi:chemotaxis protein MotA